MRSTAPYHRITVEPTGGHLGAEIGSIDLSKPVDPMNLLAVLRGWLCR